MHIPLSTFYALGDLHSNVTLLIHTQVREDAISLYGFLSAREKHLFELLISASGVGPVLALKILSGMSVEELLPAVRAGDLVRLTRIPGASVFLDGGIIAYSNASKRRWLGVPDSLLERHGAVSAEVARAMAEGVRAQARTTLGIATTGIAGPGGATAEKPVGLVYIALAHGKGTETREMRFGTEPGREGVKYLTSQSALDMIRLHLLR